ncbi:VOC family protein [Enterobacter hormaechei]|uniref:VOC family protein n=1 Tax=Enterobacter hormaechei TaxID=158836 RepID=UPI0007B3AF53|nr:VOC family protein [Enterobacter hormaechei]KZP71727.1 glyoxalase [Enterobacter hormaechei subsp. xiangfangensis]
MNTLQTQTPAHLLYLHLSSKEPLRQVDFYQRMFDLQGERQADGAWVLTGPQRAMLISEGESNGFIAAGYGVADQQTLSRLRENLHARGCATEDTSSPLLEENAFLIRDPQGRQLQFGVSQGIPDASHPGMPGRLQHVVFQTTELDTVLDFYINKVGFTVSDDVVDENNGALMTRFMRSDDEHHSLAFFRGSRNELDHHCYETNEWNDIRDWGDRFAAERISIFFGPGRHGPGNNLFFMVVDADNNRIEMSSDMEVTEPERNAGVWPHCEYSLNSWGKSWIRT